MPTFDTIRQDSDDRNLIRKIQKAIAFIAPKTVDLPDTLFSGAGTLIDLKTAGWLPIGIVTPDGYEFGRDVKAEDVTALGYASPVRSDTTEVARSIKVNPLETGRKHMLELTYGTDLTSVTQSATTGEIVFDEPDLPVDAEYRFLVIGSDGPAAENWILGRGYGSVKLSSTDSQKWGTGDAVSQPLTFNVFTDAEVGTPVKHYMGGTGALAHKTALGFTAGT
ncbi:major tail protein [Arthrobacter phage AbbyDaisy]|nr:major tail protein [Arthrobacter phage AbbyDaisy]